MIKIDNEYRINANDNCYSLERLGKVEDENSKNYGKETIITCGYYTTIESALNGYMKRQVRSFIANSKLETIERLEEYIVNLGDFIKSKFKDM